MKKELDKERQCDKVDSSKAIILDLVDTKNTDNQVKNKYIYITT